MSALRRLARPAVATAAAVLLLAGCGGDDDTDSNASSSSSSSSSSSPTSSSSSSSSAESSESSGSDEELAAFCAQAEEFSTALQQVDPADPQSIAPALAEASAAFDAAEPPQEIAEEWASLGDALRSWADTANSIDITTAEGAQQLATSTQEFQSAFTGPDGTAVDEFGSANCP